jgi:hypothetical protein
LPGQTQPVAARRRLKALGVHPKVIFAPDGAVVGDAARVSLTCRVTILTSLVSLVLVLSEAVLVLDVG